MDKKYIIGFVIGLLVIIGVLVLINAKSNESPYGDLTPFAQCLTAKKIIFYGAWWCPHCHATKAMFGTAAADLPYHECSSPDGNSQLQSCNDVGIQQYPTWIFPDGSRLTGELTLQALADKSGCALPASAQAASAPATSGQSSSAASSVVTSSTSAQVTASSSSAVQ